MGSIKSGFEQTYEWTKLIFDSLVKLVTGQFSINELSGPVGIYKSNRTSCRLWIYACNKFSGSFKY